MRVVSAPAAEGGDSLRLEFQNGFLTVTGVCKGTPGLATGGERASRIPVLSEWLKLHVHLKMQTRKKTSSQHHHSCRSPPRGPPGAGAIPGIPDLHVPV